MELNKFIEHTLLKQDATKSELIKLFNEAIEHNFLGICVNPINVKLASEYLADKDVKIVTVIGFPLGANKSEVKAFETVAAVQDGADEIDMVLNISALKDEDYEFVKNDISFVKKACQGKILKVIIETDLLSDEEIKKASELVVEAGADFVKTSTGFVKNGVGATVEAVKIMHEVVKDTNVKIKASGGIKDKQKALDLIEAGAERLGTSSGVTIVEEE